jgi:hypothetical protein
LSCRRRAENSLERLDPAEYDTAHQDAKLRAALMPDALARVRAASYAQQLQPLLHANE